METVCRTIDAKTPIREIYANLDCIYEAMLKTYDIGTYFYMHNKLKETYQRTFDPISEKRLKLAITYYLRYKEYIPLDESSDELY